MSSIPETKAKANTPGSPASTIAADRPSHEQEATYTTEDLVAAERTAAVESFSQGIAKGNMTDAQQAELQRRRSQDPEFARQLTEAVEAKEDEENLRTLIDQVAIMIVTCNITSWQQDYVHYRRQSCAEFKKALDEAVAAKANDPRLLAVRDKVMEMRREIERQRHVWWWTQWNAERAEWERIEAERAAKRRRVQR